METVRLAFYKAQKGDVWGNMIAGYTGLFNWKTPPYCHAEIGILADGVEWRWYSSASKNTSGRTGTRWINEKVLFEHPERWDVYDVEAIRTAPDMLKTCDEECGKSYDWPGILGFVTPFGQMNPRKKWYCSEICNYVFFGKWIKRVSPKRLYSKIKDRIVK